MDTSTILLSLKLSIDDTRFHKLITVNPGKSEHFELGETQEHIILSVSVMSSHPCWPGTGHIYISVHKLQYLAFKEFMIQSHWPEIRYKSLRTTCEIKPKRSLSLLRENLQFCNSGLVSSSSKTVDKYCTENRQNRNRRNAEEQHPILSSSLESAFESV